MNLQQTQKDDRKSKIITLFFDYKVKKKDIAVRLGIHRNTVGKYLKKVS